MQDQPSPRRRNLVLILIVVLIGLAFVTREFISHGTLKSLSASQRSVEPYVRELSLFGTYVRLSFWAPEKTAKVAADNVGVELQKLHNMFNVFDPRSELSRLNVLAVSEPFPCSRELWQILKECRRAYRETEGAFDVSVGPLMKLWGFHQKRATLPSQDEIATALLAVGLDKIVFDDSRKTVRFQHPDTYLDFSGIAKGYALDRAVRIARTCGISTGLIDLGGNIYCLEEPPPGRYAYTVGVRDPFDPEALLGTVQILNCAVATSGNYEQHVEIEKKTVSHIMDPRTGYPAAGVLGVTVITPLGVDSDIYSTAIFVGGEKLIRSLRHSRQRTSVLLVDLNDKGKTQTRRYGWIWKGVSE